MRELHSYQLGRVPYDETHRLQAQLQRARQLGLVGDIVLSLEHDPVITLGRAAKREHVLLDEASLRGRGIEVFETGRGGDVTYHGPGQLVVYPIVDLAPDQKDVRRYVFNLEEAMLRTVRDFGLQGTRLAGLNGTWVLPNPSQAGSPPSGERKIGAVGVRISRWVTMHGLALNVNTELDGFSSIVPCGIRSKTVTSLRQELAVPQLAMAEVEASLLENLAFLLGRDLVRHDGRPEVPADPELHATATGFA